MNLKVYAEKILFSESIEDKLIPPAKDFARKVKDFEYTDFQIPNSPARPKGLEFASNNVKFPRNKALKDPLQKAKALHAFANHELLATEMMACALLMFPSETEEQINFKKGLLVTLRDEQKHFKLYRKRINDLGYDFGDFPVNGYFWQKMLEIKTIDEYLSMMALTFESANLDFASYYHDVFLEIGDEETAKVLKVVFDDEITHVAFGVRNLDKKKQQKSLWEYYQSVLPQPLTPARAKGMQFNRKSRLLSGMSEDYVNSLEVYRDEFFVTDRKEWKN